MNISLLISVKDIFQFIKTSRFRIHFILSVISGLLILWISFKLLSVYTHHGEAILVPDFSSVKGEDLDKFIADKHLKYQVIDSVFDPEAPPGVVIKQDPESNSSVKQNRIVYLTISAKLPPLVKMPNLVDASMRQGLALLESCGLKAGRREYRPDPCVNCILAQLLKGKKIEAGSMIPKGSVIDIVLGKGEGDEKINIPCIVGLSRKEASEKIAEAGFSEGSVSCKDCKTSADKENAKVFRQEPACSSDILLNPGSSIDLFISIKKETKTNDDASSSDEE